MDNISATAWTILFWGVIEDGESISNIFKIQNSRFSQKWPHFEEFLVNLDILENTE